MKISILGTRGSLPSTNPETVKYGCNTACIEVVEGNQQIILDAGTGLLKLAKDIDMTQRRYDIFLTHLHIDHIQGLGFFKPLFNHENEIHLWGPAGSSRTLQYRLNRYLSPPLFPVHFRDLPCDTHLHEITNSEYEIGPLKIQSAFINHPGPTLGYRISNGNKSFTYIPDHEPFMGNRGWTVGNEWISGMGIAYQTDLLVHDSQYSKEEYLDKIGWGHSSIDQAIRFARLAEAKELLLFHHDPNHTDKQLEYILNSHTTDPDEGGPLVELAVEGSVYELN